MEYILFASSILFGCYLKKSKANKNISNEPMGYGIVKYIHIQKNRNQQLSKETQNLINSIFTSFTNVSGLDANKMTAEDIDGFSLFINNLLRMIHYPDTIDWENYKKKYNKLVNEL